MSITSVTASPGANAPSSSTTATDPTAKLANENTFLQLLVAQIQNQDPLQPQDSMQFVSQLAQFSQLEQLIGINKGVTTLDSSFQSTTTNTAANNTPVQG